MDNSRILVIPDLHFPYCHPDSLDFLAKIKSVMQPSRVICLGDELDYHAMSFHDSDPDLDSAGTELLKAIGYIETLFKLFPEMELMDSNHGSMAYRKAKHHGFPRHLLKSYNEVLEVGNSWRWHDKLILNLPNGNSCLVAHTLGADILRASQKIGMSAIQGHHHGLFEIRFWNNGITRHFGMSSGCLVDDKSLALAYNKVDILRPQVGASFLDNSEPLLIPMKVNANNEWTGTRI